MFGKKSRTLYIAICRKTFVSRFRIPKVPLWTCGAGLIGIVTIFFSNIAFSNLNMTLATAAVLAGQVTCGPIFDATGFMGSRKIPIGNRQLISLGLILTGMTAMVLWQ